MPIVNIIVPSAESTLIADPAEIFAGFANISPKLVTVNVHSGTVQYGNAYRAIVNIVVPECWEEAAKEQLLRAASTMLEQSLQVSPQESIVYLTLVRSGQVADRGTVQRW